MKVTLLKDLGDHSKGDTLDIKDVTVLKAWKSAKLIDAKTKIPNEVNEDEEEVEANEAEKVEK